MKILGGRNDDTKRLERLIAGIQELISAMNGEMRLRRGNEAQFEILFLNGIARSKRDSAASEKKKS
jgi:hypothetical protein